MPAILGALLAVIVVAVVLQPLFTMQRKPTQPRREPEQLREERRAIYREITNLRNDYESGHIGKAELDLQTEQLRRDAAVALRDEDHARADAIASEIEIEAEVQKLRERPDTANGKD